MKTEAQRNHQTLLPEIAVIVPCLGHADVLRKCLSALYAQDFEQNYQVIVVDSASDDGVARTVSEFPSAKLVRSQTPLAPGPARNLGVSVASAALLAFTDADCRPESGFLCAAHAALSGGAKVVTGPVLDAPGGFIASCDNLLQFVDFSATRPAGRADYAPGCNLAIRKADFLEIGAFPDGGAEDARLSITIMKKWPDKFIFVPEMRIQHHGRATLGALIKHHRSFGRERAKHGIRLQTWQKSLGRYRIMFAPIVAKRLSYLLSRTFRWNRRRLPFLMSSLPILIIGLLAWAQGFRNGLITQDKTAG